MQKIKVRNIGPLKHIDLEIKDFVLFIGENASGKSTLLKLIYFFNKLSEYIAFLFNQGNKFCITTHSFHLLGIVNNLINANRIGRENGEEVNKIINKEYWLDSSKVFVGELKDGKLTNIYDAKNELYDLDFLSKVPGEINTDYGKLPDLEFEEVDE